MADRITPWDDKRQFPVIADARDLQIFGKLAKSDVLGASLWMDLPHQEVGQGGPRTDFESGREANV